MICAYLPAFNSCLDDMLKGKRDSMKYNVGDKFEVTINKVLSDGKDTCLYQIRGLDNVYLTEEDLDAINSNKVDWHTIPVDTMIYVRDSEEDEWKPRHFAKYEDDMIHTWVGGTTSFTTHGNHTSIWKYAKLVTFEDLANMEVDK